MTDLFGVALYVLAVAIAIWFGLRVRGQSFAEILSRRTEEHHHVAAVLAEHPQGGSYRELRRWEELPAAGNDLPGRR